MMQSSRLPGIPFIIIVLLASLVTSLSGCRHAKNLDSQIIQETKEAEQSMDEGHYDDALEILHKASATIEGDSSVTDSLSCRVYMLIGNIYLAYNDFTDALDYYSKSLSLASDDSQLLFHLLQNTTVAACFTGNIPLAKETNHRLEKLEVPESMQAKKESDLAIGRAFIAKHSGLAQESASEFRTSLDIIRQSNLSDREKPTPLSELYEYYDRIGVADSALIYLLEYDSLARVCLIPQMMADSRRGLLHSYIILNDSLNALKAFQSYFDVVDSLYRPQMFVSLNNRFHNANLNRAKEKINHLESTVYVQKTLLAALAFIVALLVWLIFMRKRMVTLRRDLFRKNREIVIMENELTIQASPQPRTIKEIDKQQQLLREIMETVDNPEVLCNPDLSLEMVAKIIGSNSKYVSSAINESTGDNFRTFINKRRIHEARKRLTHGSGYENLTIRAIGESVGFRSHTNFINAFKKVTGLTPSMYLKMDREPC